MIEVSWEKDRILDILGTVDNEKEDYPQCEIAEIADKLQELLDNIQKYLLE